MAREIERRFLVRDVRILDGRKGERIVQGYLAKESGAMSTRVRIRGDRAWLTLKSPKQGYSRDEFEYAIPVADAQALLANHCAQRVVRKTRYLVDHAHHLFEVDVFEGHHAGLVVAEVELPHEQAPVSLPGWVGEEITHDARYGNFTLAVESALRASAGPAPESRHATKTSPSAPKFIVRA
ncbi:MAG TPA: adenylate cyclase [Thauera sp.]|nr:adenylate cyclase [Thauera sp.]